MALNHFIDAAKLKTDTAIGVDLSGNVADQASLYAFYGSQAALAARQAAMAKLKVEIAEATIDKLIRENAAVTNSKTTETQIRNEIVRSKEYQAAKVTQIEADSIAELCKVAADAMKQKKDMLVTSSLTARDEAKGEMFIKARDAASADARGRLRDALAGTTAVV